MNKVYLDNGATSFPKAPGVSRAMVSYLDEVGANVARGGYESAYSAAETVLDTRERLAELFGAPSAKNVLFTGGMTLAVNMLLWGLLQSGDHVVTSSMEHNAVMRPLALLERRGVQHSCVPCDVRGQLDPNVLEHAIQPNTKLVILLHASNVCGTILPIAAVGEICKRRGIFFIVDAAQTAGTLPLTLQGCAADAIAMPAHKGLLGPSGLGCFIIGDKLAHAVEPLIGGGTGSISDTIETPSFLPDKFEAGTMNIPGIYGLNAALLFLKQQGCDAIANHELDLACHLMEGVQSLSSVSIIGIPERTGRVAVVSLDFPLHDNAEIAFLLESRFGIMTRCGLHCAPNAHKTLGSYPHGSVRFVPGYANTIEEINYTLEAIKALTK